MSKFEYSIYLKNEKKVNYLIDFNSKKRGGGDGNKLKSVITQKLRNYNAVKKQVNNKNKLIKSVAQKKQTNVQEASPKIIEIPPKINDSNSIIKQSLAGNKDLISLIQSKLNNIDLDENLNVKDLIHQVVSQILL